MASSKKLGRTYLPSLPNEIMIEILVRLPVDSILALKCVSKEWGNLISDSKFYSIYHTNSIAFFVEEATLYCVLFKQKNTVQQQQQLLPYTVHSLPIPLQEKSDGNSSCHELLSGWSNGMVCVKADNGFFFLYNLLTATYCLVADAPQQRYQDSFMWIYYGFGYDPYGDDYKVLVVPSYDGRSRRVPRQNQDNSLFWVYSLKNRRGKWFDGFPYASYSYHHDSDLYNGAYSFKGFLHLVMTTAGGNEIPKLESMPTSKAILTFDLHACRFGEMLLPGPGGFGPCKVAELDGRLCLVHETYFIHGYASSLVELWVMKEYGVVASWTKLYTCSLKGNPAFYVKRLSHTMLYECRDGTKGVLITSHETPESVWYDIHRNRVGYLSRWN